MNNWINSGHIKISFYNKKHKGTNKKDYYVTMYIFVNIKLKQFIILRKKNLNDFSEKVKRNNQK